MKISLNLHDLALLVHIMLNEVELQEKADLAIKEQIEFIEDSGSEEYQTTVHHLVETGPFEYGDFDDDYRGNHIQNFDIGTDELTRLINIVKPVSKAENEIALVEKLESFIK